MAKPLILRIRSLSSRAFSFFSSWLVLGRVGWKYGLTVTKWLHFFKKKYHLAEEASGGPPLPSFA
jgi:hypothetical protein